MAFELPRVPPALPGDYGQFKLWWAGTFSAWWQQVVEKIEAQEAAQDDLLAQIIAAQAAADAAAADAASAASDAAAADDKAVAGARETARLNSYPSPGNILSATDTGGGTAKITIAAHMRVYSVQGSIAVPDVVIPAPADITGLANATKYFVYYDDPTLADTTPTYQATTVAATAQPGAAAGRHIVGFITTPAGGGGGTSGTGGNPPGGAGGSPTGYVEP